MIDRGGRRDSVKLKSKSNITTGKDNAAEPEVDENANSNGDINNILIDMGTLRLCYEELKLVQTEMKKTDDKRAAKF